jgi:putative ABC transport system permease protein
MHHLLADIRFTFRLMRRSPAFFATILTVLIAGIGATTAMFSIVNSLLLKPLPYKNADDLMMVWRRDARSTGDGPASVPDFLDWKAQATNFEQMTGVEYAGFGFKVAGTPSEGISGAAVSSDFFPMFDLHPLHGRFLEGADDLVGAPRCVVISAALWHRRFNSDVHAVGSMALLNGESYTVIGVAPEGFSFAGPHMGQSDAWISLTSTKTYATYQNNRGSHFLTVLARLRHGVAMSTGQAQLSAIAAALKSSYPETNTHKGDIRLGKLQDDLVGPIRSTTWTLFAAIGLVFLMVCANTGTLLLSRAQTRRGEMATRAALGATLARTTAQIITETLVLFLIAAIFGAVVAPWLIQLFSAAALKDAVTQTISVQVDGATLGFCAALSLLSGLGFGLLPALIASRSEPHAALQSSSARAGIGRYEKLARAGLVVAQITIACALLVGSGLALKHFAALAVTPPGFSVENLATARLLMTERYNDDDAALGFYQRLSASVVSIPGVTEVAITDSLPMGGSNRDGFFEIEGRIPWVKGEEPLMKRDTIMPGYFKALGIPILRGREFTGDDSKAARLVMVLSEDAAKAFFPGQDPLGQRIDLGDNDENDGKHQWREIIGIVGNVRARGLMSGSVAESYVPWAQHGSRWPMIAIRSPRATSILQELPKIVDGIDSQQGLFRPKLMTDLVADTTATQRYIAVLLSAFAAVALLLATVGLFGLISYSTSQRTREIGLRMALGATPEAVIRMILRDGLRLLAVGLGFGLVGAFFAGRALASRVPGLPAFDATVFGIVPLVLSIACMLACLLPAWRAARIPPAIALRSE